MRPHFFSESYRPLNASRNFVRHNRFQEAPALISARHAPIVTFAYRRVRVNLIPKMRDGFARSLRHDSHMQSTYNGIPDGISIGSQLLVQSNARGTVARRPSNLTAGFKRTRPRTRTTFKGNLLVGRLPRNCPRRFVRSRDDAAADISNFHQHESYSSDESHALTRSSRNTCHGKEQSFTHQSAVLCARKDFGKDKDRW